MRPSCGSPVFALILVAASASCSSSSQAVGDDGSGGSTASGGASFGGSSGASNGGTGGELPGSGGHPGGSGGLGMPTGGQGGSSGAAGVSGAAGGLGGADGLSGAAGAAGADTAGGPGNPVDTTAPSVLQITPAADSHGVLADVDIVIRFSEPMNAAATQLAFQSLTLPPATFTWNESGTELTIDPTTDLAYASGRDPATTVARSYEFVLTSAATDRAGNPLAANSAVTFFTSREIRTTLYWDENSVTGALTGWAVPDSSSNWVEAYAGDTATNVQEKGAATFDLREFDPSVQAIRSATLRAGLLIQRGADPFSLGTIMVEDISFDDLDAFYALPAPTRLGTLFTSADGPGTLDVTAAVRDDFARRATDGLTQFRFSFTTPTNHDGENDSARISPSLDVAYLMP